MSRGRASARFAWWACLVTMAGLAVPTAARATGFEAGPLAIAVAFMPWVTVACALPLVLAIIARSWVLVLSAAAIAALCVAWQVPLFTGGGQGEPELTVATINMRFGEADPDAIVTLVRDRHVDVLVLSELTPDAVGALHDAGLSTELTYEASRPEEGFSGTGLWSRYALSDVVPLEGFMSQNLRARVAAPDGAITVFAVHPRAPRNSKHHVWDEEMAGLMDYLAAASGPVIVAGDFNTTRDHAAFRAIESLGYRDADDQAGTGFAPTFPQGRGLGPLLAIDHVLERDTGLAAVRTTTIVVPRADHRALVVDYGTGQ